MRTCLADMCIPMHTHSATLVTYFNNHNINDNLKNICKHLVHGMGFDYVIIMGGEIMSEEGLRNEMPQNNYHSERRPV
jgi:hypothetical protein